MPDKETIYRGQMEISLQSLVTSLQPMEGTCRVGSWKYTEPAGREGRAWGSPLQRQGLANR